MSENPFWLSAVVEMNPPSEADLAVASETAEEALPPAEVPAEVKLDQPPTPHAGAGHTHRTEGIKITPAEAKVARLKQYFTTSGFEVHAPVRHTFSIGARQEVFERFFDVSLEVSSDIVGTRVVPDELPVAGLPEEFRESVARITFPAPPNLLSE